MLDAEARDPRERHVRLAEREPHLEEGVEIELQAAVHARHHQTEDAGFLEHADGGVGRTAQALGFGSLGGEIRYQRLDAFEELASFAGQRVHG